MSKKVLVTGAAGFLGSNVADILTEKGYQVRLFDTKNSIYQTASQEMFVGDILNEKDLDKALCDIDYVYHFAGISDIDECAQKPVDTININVLGTTKLLDACVKNNIKRVLFASTVYVYSDSGYFYKVSKQACENIIEEYNQLFDLKYTILRFGSLYGERSDERNSIYRFIKQAILEDKITYHGTGEEIREFIHVHDAAELAVKCLDNSFEDSRIIISGNEKYRYKDLLLMIKEILHNKVDIDILPSTRTAHYSVTPYNFSPKTAKKIASSASYDLGQGILNLIKEVYEENAK